MIAVFIIIWSTEILQGFKDKCVNDHFWICAVTWIVLLLIIHVEQRANIYAILPVIYCFHIQNLSVNVLTSYWYDVCIIWRMIWRAYVWVREETGSAFTCMIEVCPSGRPVVCSYKQFEGSWRVLAVWRNFTLWLGLHVVNCECFFLMTEMTIGL